MKPNRGIRNKDLLLFLLLIVLPTFLFNLIKDKFGSLWAYLFVIPSIFLLSMWIINKDFNKKTVNNETKVLNLAIELYGAVHIVFKEFNPNWAYSFSFKKETVAFVAGAFFTKAKKYVPITSEKNLWKDFLCYYFSNIWNQIDPQLKAQARLYSTQQDDDLYKELFKRIAYLYVNNNSYKMGVKCNFDLSTELPKEVFEPMRKASHKTLEMLNSRINALPTL